jgi:formylglycine-generating enzyme required for sulfatase activity
MSAGRLPVGFEYRLPIEAEWEYSCRAGTTTRFSFGNDTSYTLIEDYAWINTIRPVGGKLSNPWGLYDMHGNVVEVCLDSIWSYPGGNITDPKWAWPNTSKFEVFRGGGSSEAKYCRSASRGLNPDNFQDGETGFRIILAPIY